VFSYLHLIFLFLSLTYSLKQSKKELSGGSESVTFKERKTERVGTARRITFPPQSPNFLNKSHYSNPQTLKLQMANFDEISSAPLNSNSKEARGCICCCCPRNPTFRKICIIFTIIFLGGLGAFLGLAYSNNFWVSQPEIKVTDVKITQDEWKNAILFDPYVKMTVSLNLHVDNPNTMSITAKYIHADVYIKTDDWIEGEEMYYMGKASTQKAFKIKSNDVSTALIVAPLKQTGFVAISIIGEIVSSCASDQKIKLHLVVTAGVDLGPITIPIPEIPLDIQVSIPYC